MEEIDFNEIRAEEAIKKYGLPPKNEYREAIIDLLQQELKCPKEGSSEYLSVLCGMLFCIGNKEDARLIEKVKYGINMDVGFMIDLEWIESLKGMTGRFIRMREEIVQDIIGYYEN